MKKKDLLMKIKNTADNEMPDILNKINLNKIIVEDIPEPVKARFSFRKAMSYAMSSFIIIVSAVLIYNLVIIPSTPDLTPLENENELIGFQSVSAASMLDIDSITNLSSVETFDNNLVTLSTTTNVTESDIDDQMDVINNYLNMMETVLGDEDYLLYQELDSDNPEYGNLIQFKSMDLNGNLIQYRIYYNKELINDDYVIDGIMIYNQETYNFDGSINKDNPNMNSVFTAYIDEDNYVQVRNVSTASSQMFQYRIMKNAEVFNESRVTILAERNALKAKVETQNNGNDLTLTVSRGNTSSNSNMFNVEYSLKNQAEEKNGNFQVGLMQNNDTGQYMYSYQFNNNQQANGWRKGKGNRPASNDDFKNDVNITTNNYTTTQDIPNTQTTTEDNTNGSASNTVPGNTHPSGNTDSTSPGSTQNNGHMSFGIQNTHM